MDNMFDELIKIREKNAYTWSQVYRAIGISPMTFHKLRNNGDVCELVVLKVKKYINENKGQTNNE